MSKSEIIEIICSFFGLTADKQKQLHPEEVARWIASAYNTVMYNLCEVRDFSQLDPFIKPFTVTVMCDEVRNEYYSILPISVIALPKNRGVYRISPIKDQKFQFVFRANGTQDIYDCLEYAIIRKKPSFYIEMNKVFYDNKMTSDLASAGVLMKLIPTFEAYEDNDIIPMVGGKDNDILKLIISELSAHPLEDTKSNSEPNTIQSTT